jgi:dihydroorotase-like cyclic amidohydrolase
MSSVAVILVSPEKLLSKRETIPRIKGGAVHDFQAIPALEAALTNGARADIIVFDPDRPWVLEKTAIRSRTKNSPFVDARFSGRVLHTVVAGKRVFEHG